MAIIKLTKDNYNETVSKKESIVIVDFWAEWCGPCRMLAPELEKLCEKHPEITVGKVNVDEQPELSRDFRIMSIPTIIIYKNGVEEKQLIGYKNVDELEQLVF